MPSTMGEKFVSKLLIKQYHQEVKTASSIERQCKQLQCYYLENKQIYIRTPDLYFLWSMFSSERNAKWLIVDENTISDFYDYLTENCQV